jgi:2-keto-4-pentenoate hydratase/2-oxohepta-3-ene-1,7-dioic acid hydratase in catechol pathway
MKLASFTEGSRASYGMIAGDTVVDLGRVFADRYPSLRHFLAQEDFRGQAESIEGRATKVNLASVEFAPVIPNPDKIICVGMNYRDHVAEIGRTVTERPALFARFADSQVGHQQSLIKPKISNEYDYEGELAVVIGKGGRHIPETEALAHVAGYSCYNEGSIRDWQRHTGQFLSGKSFSSSGSFGPWLVTADEIADPAALSLETRLNGQVVQTTNTGNLINSIPVLIAYCSTIFKLVPGDVIVTGTPGGVGFKRNPPLFMKAGDIVEVEISGVGTLRNQVVNEV